MFSVTKLNPRRRKSYGSDWKKTAKRDREILGLKCEKCGSTDKVERHHILEKTRHKGADCPLNLKLLCRTCHRRHHAKRHI